MQILFNFLQFYGTVLLSKCFNPIMINKKKKKIYYGRKGGSAEFKDEVKFDIYSTMKSLREYYKAKNGVKS